MACRRVILAATGTAAALAAAGCGGADDDKGSAAKLGAYKLVSYDSCDDLLKGLRKAAATRVGPYGLPGDEIVPLYGRQMPSETGDRTQTAPQQPKAPEHSKTNTHEAGADEPDKVKTDGRRIVTIAKDRLQVVDAASRKVSGRLTLPGSGKDWSAETLLLHGDRALVFQRKSVLFRPGVPFKDDVPDDRRPIVPQRSQYRLLLVDLAASGGPREAGSMTVDGSYVDARQTGSVARVVVRSRPDIKFPQPGVGKPRPDAIEKNREIVKRAPLDAWLPRYEVNSGGRTKKHTVPCERISHPTRDYSGTSMLNVLTLDLGKGLGDADPVSVVADGDKVYGNGSSLYVTDSRTPVPSPVDDTPGAPSRPADVPTEIHKFDVSGNGRPRYAASGSVPGRLLNQYSMSEHQGHLRIATTSGESLGTRKSDSTVYVMAQKGRALTTVGKAGGLGKGERIYAVRFIGPTAYVVTFRQVDPLYVLDLSNPQAPAVKGELKIRGYSAYLHPAGEGRLIGIGQDATKRGRTLGTQVSLFDVSNPAAPRRIDTLKAGKGTSEAEYNPHAFLYWPKDGTTVIPVTSLTNSAGNSSLVLRITPDGISKTGTLRQRGDLTGNQRSLIIGESLWTVSDSGAQSSDKATLTERGTVPFT